MLQLATAQRTQSMASVRRVVVWVAAGLVAAGAVSVSVFLAVGAPADDTAAGDAARVFCLSHEHRTQLTDAARNLTVNIPPNGLREGKGPEFDRVCAALVGAVQIPQRATSGPTDVGRSTFDVLWPIIVGAALTWLTGFWRDERTQSRLLADALGHAWGKYFSAADAQCRKLLEGGQGKIPVDQVVLDERDGLAAQLRKVAVLRPGWTVPGRLRQQLSDAQLGQKMNDLGERESPEQRDERLHKALNALREPIDDIVSALERPWRWHGEMRTKHSAKADATRAG